MYMYICILYVYIRVNMSVSRKAEIDWRSVGRRVREIRGFDDNQEVFSRALGVSQGQLSRYERGESEIGAAVLLRLARKSRKTIEWLLTGDQTLKNVRDEGRKG
jgi:transcriptional regulator with XRE-family HTH domain